MLSSALKVLIAFLTLECSFAGSGNARNHGFLIVSTLNGEITALELDRGDERWRFGTNELLVSHSSISDLQIVRDGREIKLIPSLNGGLYQYDGEAIRYFPLRIETLLARSQQISESLLATGELSTAVYGIDKYSGEVLYMCEKDGCAQTNTAGPSAESDILVFTRRRETLRAVDIRHGSETWNYSVTHFDLLLRNGASPSAPTTQPAADYSVVEHAEGADPDVDVSVSTPRTAKFVTVDVAERKIALREVLANGETVNSWQRSFDVGLAQVWYVAPHGHLRKLTALESRIDVDFDLDLDLESPSPAAARRETRSRAESGANEKSNAPSRVVLPTWQPRGHASTTDKNKATSAVRTSVLYLGSYGGQLYVNANFDRPSDVGTGASVAAGANSVTQWKPYIGSSASRTPVLQPCSTSLWRYDRDPSAVSYPFDSGLCLRPTPGSTPLLIGSDADSAGRPETGSVSQFLEQRDDSKTIAIVFPISRPDWPASVLNCENDSCDTSAESAATAGGDSPRTSSYAELAGIPSLWAYWRQVAVISMITALVFHLLLVRVGRSRRLVYSERPPVLHIHLFVRGWLTRTGNGSAPHALQPQLLAQLPYFGLQRNAAQSGTSYGQIHAATDAITAANVGPVPVDASSSNRRESETNSLRGESSRRPTSSISASDSVSANSPKVKTDSRQNSINLDPPNASALVTEFVSRYETDYEHNSCLGWGGFGVVFKARNRIDDQFYAVKRITLRGSARSRARMMREVKCLAKLDHPHVVRFYQAWFERPPAGWQTARDREWLRCACSNAGVGSGSDVDPPDSLNDLLSGGAASVMSGSARASNAPRHAYASTSASASASMSQQHSNDTSLSSDDDSATDSHDTELGRVDLKDLRLKHKNAADSVDIVFASSSRSNNNNSMSQSLASKADVQNSDINRANANNGEDDGLAARQAATGRAHHSETSEYLYIQMQLCNESLKEWLVRDNERVIQCRKTQMSTSDPCLFQFRDRHAILSIFEQIADAVCYIHQAQLIHRDLKPSNILFSLDGRVIVGDFGLVTAQFGDEHDTLPPADETARTAAASSHTREVGTQTYMSPEQRNGRAYDEKVDVYALGLIFFELLHPFSTEMERARLLGDAKRGTLPHTFSSKQPADCALLLRMLAELPDHRPSSKDLLSSEPLNELRRARVNADTGSSILQPRALLNRLLPRSAQSVNKLSLAVSEAQSTASSQKDSLSVSSSSRSSWNPFARRRGLSRCESTPNAVALEAQEKHTDALPAAATPAGQHGI